MSDDEEAFDWICGADENLSHRRVIGSGGFGEVHEVSVNCDALTIQMVDNANNHPFARKLIHFNRSTKADIKHEVKVMSDLLRTSEPATQNIVTILRHGQLERVLGYYFIDMELGMFDLEAYLKACKEDKGISWASLQDCSPVIVQNGCPPIAKLQNWCTIGAHIASGLKYMHSHQYVHRDLKPANGIQLLRSYNE
jgi:serine/threonine protein kinase